MTHLRTFADKSRFGGHDALLVGVVAHAFAHLQELLARPHSKNVRKECGSLEELKQFFFADNGMIEILKIYGLEVSQFRDKARAMIEAAGYSAELPSSNDDFWSFADARELEQSDFFDQLECASAREEVLA